MLPLREHWIINLRTPVEVSLPELGTRPSDEECEASYDQWFFIREMLRYPESECAGFANTMTSIPPPIC